MAKCSFETEYLDHIEEKWKVCKCNRLSLEEADEDGKKYCIFHSRRRDKDVEEFYRGFKKLYELGKHNFIGFAFPKDLEFGRLREETGELQFKDAIFKESFFLCTADFRGAEFSGDVGADFSRVNFSGEGRTDFRQTKFSHEGGAYFDWLLSTSKEGISFRGAKFDGKRETIFSRAKLIGKGIIDFREAEFVGKGKVTFEGRIFHDIKEVNFIQAKFENPHNVIFSRIDLNKCRFLGADLRNIQFKEVFWTNREYQDTGQKKGGFFKKRKMIYDEKFQAGLFINRGGAKDHERVYRLYNQLRLNYEDNGMYFDAGDFFIGAMEMRRRGNFEHFGIRAMLSLYKLISLYGERPLRAFMWILILILAASFLSLLVGIEPIQTGLDKIQFNSLDFNTLLTKEFWRNYLEGLYVILNILTLGKVKSLYTIDHSIWGLILNTSVVVFGATFFSLFILAMNRKFRRTKD